MWNSTRDLLHRIPVSNRFIDKLFQYAPISSSKLLNIDLVFWAWFFFLQYFALERKDYILTNNWVESLFNYFFTIHLTLFILSKNEMFLFAKQNILDEFSIEESKQKISQAKIIKLASSNLSGIGESEWVIQERGMIRFNPRIWVTAIVKTPLSSWLSFFRIFFFFFPPYLAFSHVACVAARDHSLFFLSNLDPFFRNVFFERGWEEIIY